MILLKTTFDYIFIIPALLGAFGSNQSMVVFPRCGGIRPYVWFPVDWATMAMVVTVSPAAVKCGDLIVEATQVLLTFSNEI